MDGLDELMARCGLRDQGAFAELYRRTSGRLLAVALRIVRRRDWAEEILQESFVSIWHHAPGFDRVRSAPMTWMTTIVRNRALDWVRRPRHEQSGEDLEGLTESWTDEGPGPLERLQNSSDSIALARCLDELSGQQRQSIALAYLHGLSHSELAEHLGQPLGTIKTWIRRGLEKLRGCIDAVTSEATSR
ncbi:MAG: sigma-70 family RNA polymerase sigma factor [Betaproteobacteria bacterium]|nr:sigma-70 family RNA polymerase sigma factor [Betaproteobacteria bacterium]